MASSKKTRSAARTLPQFICVFAAGTAPLVLNDKCGRLWRIDPASGTMRPVIVEKPSGRSK